MSKKIKILKEVTISGKVFKAGVSLSVSDSIALRLTTGKEIFAELVNKDAKEAVKPKAKEKE